MTSATYFGCHEFKTTAEGTSLRTIPHVLFAVTVVADLDVSIKSQKNVV